MARKPVETMREWKIRCGAKIPRPVNVGISGIYGIVKSGKSWMVQLWHNGDPHYFGRYPTITEAIPALIEGRRSLGITGDDLYEGLPPGWDLV